MQDYPNIHPCVKPMNPKRENLGKCGLESIKGSPMELSKIVGETKAMSSDIGMITRHGVVFGGRVCACVLKVRSSSSFMWAQNAVGQL